ncbi:other/FunK1 protein kinase [Coprinopsis cinerea AmutBmut pab1-1]|nr:other/FunK1 protein kinase [Coprinopsis cinerea AmutBmut pab1-1]
MVNDVTVCNFEPNPGIQLDAVVEELKKQKMLVSRRGSVRQKPSSSQKGSLLSHTFKSFKSLFKPRTTNPTRIMRTMQTIGNAVRSALGKATDCAANDFCVRVENNTGPAAYGCLSSKLEGPLRSTDVMVPIMAIPNDYDNEPKSNQENTVFLSCAAEIMHGDARRIFCYGITLEGPEVTMWRLSRTLTMKSTPFDMTERPDLLIQLFTSLLSSSACDLGHDPLVTLLPDANYIYEIPSDGGTGPLYYRTITSICDALPSGVSGRRLRVWEVEQVESLSNPVRVPGTTTRALKDVFLDFGVRTEADIQQDLFDDIEKLAQDAAWRSRPLLKDFPQRDINDESQTCWKAESFDIFSPASSRSTSGKLIHLTMLRKKPKLGWMRQRITRSTVLGSRRWSRQSPVVPNVGVCSYMSTSAHPSTIFPPLEKPLMY